MVVALAWTACSVAGPDASARIEPGQDFSLKPGESALARDGDLRIGFEKVTVDSRCPKGEQCIRAGDATVMVWLQQGTGARETRELRLSPGAAQSVQVLDRFVRLVRLDPYPVTGRDIAKSDYVATMNLGSSAQGAER